jgi:hypothetical protein
MSVCLFITYEYTLFPHAGPTAIRLAKIYCMGTFSVKNKVLIRRSDVPTVLLCFPAGNNLTSITLKANLWQSAVRSTGNVNQSPHSSLLNYCVPSSVGTLDN